MNLLALPQQQKTSKTLKRNDLTRININMLDNELLVDFSATSTSKIYSEQSNKDLSQLLGGLKGFQIRQKKKASTIVINDSKEKLSLGNICTLISRKKSMFVKRDQPKKADSTVFQNEKMLQRIKKANLYLLFLIGVLSKMENKQHSQLIIQQKKSFLNTLDNLKQNNNIQISKTNIIRKKSQSNVQIKKIQTLENKPTILELNTKQIAKIVPNRQKWRFQQQLIKESKQLKYICISKIKNNIEKAQKINNDPYFLSYIAMKAKLDKNKKDESRKTALKKHQPNLKIVPRKCSSPAQQQSRKQNKVFERKKGKKISIFIQKQDQQRENIKNRSRSSSVQNRSRTINLIQNIQEKQQSKHRQNIHQLLQLDNILNQRAIKQMRTKKCKTSLQDLQQKYLYNNKDEKRRLKNMRERYRLDAQILRQNLLILNQTLKEGENLCVQFLGIIATLTEYQQKNTNSIIRQIIPKLICLQQFLNDVADQFGINPPHIFYEVVRQRQKQIKGNQINHLAIYQRRNNVMSKRVNRKHKKKRQYSVQWFQSNIKALKLSLRALTQLINIFHTFIDEKIVCHMIGLEPKIQLNIMEIRYQVLYFNRQAKNKVFFGLKRQANYHFNGKNPLKNQNKLWQRLFVLKYLPKKQQILKL